MHSPGSNNPPPPWVTSLFLPVTRPGLSEAKPGVRRHKRQSHNLNNEPGGGRYDISDTGFLDLAGRVRGQVYTVPQRCCLLCIFVQSGLQTGPASASSRHLSGVGILTPRARDTGHFPETSKFRQLGRWLTAAQDDVGQQGQESPHLPEFSRPLAR